MRLIKYSVTVVSSLTTVNYYKNSLFTQILTRFDLEEVTCRQVSCWAQFNLWDVFKKLVREARIKLIAFPPPFVSLL